MKVSRRFNGKDRTPWNPARLSAPVGRFHSPVAIINEGAFTLVEVMVMMGLVVILFVAGMGALLSMDICTRRAADYNAVLAVVEAKIEDIRAATYNPPNSPWTSSAVYLTNSDSIALNKAGVTFRVSGTVLSRIEPVTAGHLVTVTGTFQQPRGPALVVSLQTLVNKYSGGQQ